MDTDVEVTRTLDDFLVHCAFAGSEDNVHISTGIIGAEVNNSWISYLLTYYSNRHFIKLNGKCDTTTNVQIITKMTNINKKITADYIRNINDVIIYPREYFYPKDFKTGILCLTDNTYAIHHFEGSWLPKNRQEKAEVKKVTNRIKRLILRNKLKTQKIKV